MRQQTVPRSNPTQAFSMSLCNFESTKIQYRKTMNLLFLIILLNIYEVFWQINYQSMACWSKHFGVITTHEFAWRLITFDCQRRWVASTANTVKYALISPGKQRFPSRQDMGIIYVVSAAPSVAPHL